jgi:hypothetical protein
MDNAQLKQKLKELRQQYPAASFEWIWNKAHELLQPENQPYQMGQFSRSDHEVSQPLRVEGGWRIPVP